MSENAIEGSDNITIRIMPEDEYFMVKKAYLQKGDDVVGDGELVLEVTTTGNDN